MDRIEKKDVFTGNISKGNKHQPLQFLWYITSGHQKNIAVKLINWWIFSFNTLFLNRR